MSPVTPDDDAPIPALVLAAILVVLIALVRLSGPQDVIVGICVGATIGCLIRRLRK